MKVRIEPSVPAGQAFAPPSKSIAHRLIICAALANGKSTIKNISLSQDILATLDCVRALGAETEYKDGVLTVQGIDTDKLRILSVLPCRECGSTLRFFIPLCMLTENTCILTGSDTLLQRPLSVYETVCSAQGIPFVNNGKQIEIGGKLQPGCFEMPGNISSQFISGLLFALPLLSADSEIIITGAIESRPYIDLTINSLSAYGIKISWKDKSTLFIHENQKYIAADTENEGDWSNAAFLYALQYCGYPVTVSGTDPDSLQGDKICIPYFDALKNGAATLNIADVPDLAPILFVFAALHNGGTFTGTARLRMKESDRGTAMAAELSKFGVRTEIKENEIRIFKSDLHAPEQELYGHNDHRVVMSLAVMCIRYGGGINGAQAVNKSYPGFFEDLGKLKVDIKYEA